MKNELRTLSVFELHQVSAAHGSGFLGYLGLLHVAIGAIEFYNYVGARVINGCNNIEEDDLFSSHVCSAGSAIYNFVKGPFTTTSPAAATSSAVTVVQTEL